MMTEVLARGRRSAFEIIKGTGSPKNFKQEREDGGLGPQAIGPRGGPGRRDPVTRRHELLDPERRKTGRHTLTLCGKRLSLPGQNRPEDAATDWLRGGPSFGQPIEDGPDSRVWIPISREQPGLHRRRKKKRRGGRGHEQHWSVFSR